MSTAKDDIQTLTRIIIQEYQPDSIILFGSQARGDAGEDSDIDLLVVSDREKDLPLVKRGLSLRLKMAKVRTPWELLIYTKAEVEKYKTVRQSFNAAVEREGVVLYGQ